MLERNALIFFIMIMVAVGIAGISVLVAVWKKVIDRSQEDEIKLRPTQQEITSKLIFSVIAVMMFLLTCIVGYTYVNNTYGQPADMPNPAAEEHVEGMESHETEADEDMEKRSAEQEEKRYGHPHEKSVDSYEEKMRQEAQKIKDRNDLE